MKYIVLFLVVLIGAGNPYSRDYELKIIPQHLNEVAGLQKKKKIPRFEDYPVLEEFKGKPAPINVESHPLAKKYKTLITPDAKLGPNFAGHYTVVTWEYGTKYKEVAIVDATNGNVYFPDIIAEYEVDFQIDSKLLIVNIPAWIKKIYGNEVPEWQGTDYYKWENNKLTLIYTTRREKQ
jgi:hypothetical protein